MNRRRALPRREDLVWLSGWVFADLLLGLAVIFLAGTRGSSLLEIAALTPSLTPTITASPTIGPSPTPYPTYTPGPSPTPYPTYTRGPSPTPYPTYTPPPAPTAYPTYTPGPSPTAYPTYTPGPTATSYPTYTPGPPIAAGLDIEPYDITLRTDPSLFFSSDSKERQTAETQLRQQIHACLDSATGTKAGMVLATGYNPDVSSGHDLALRAMSLLKQEIPAPFAATVQKDYHALTVDPLLNGMITLEVYFVDDARVPALKSLLGGQCTPPPRTWCQGTPSARSLIVYNWDVLPYVPFTLDNRTYTIKPAKGNLQNGTDRTVGCIMVTPGRHTWSAGSAAGSFNVEVNRDPDPIRLCYSPAQICPGGQGPQTPAPGIR